MSRHFDTNTKINRPEVVDGVDNTNSTPPLPSNWPAAATVLRGMTLGERNAKTAGFQNAFILFYMRNLLYCIVSGVNGQINGKSQLENSEYQR